jgi:hypothetical protein
MELWHNYLDDPYRSLLHGLKHNRDNILIINYDDIVCDTDRTLKKVYDFLDLPDHKHELIDIENTCAETKDDAWGFENLHTIRPEVVKTSDDPVSTIGIKLCEYFDTADIEMQSFI